MIIKVSNNSGCFSPSQPTLVPVPRQTSFHVPRGRYAATVRGVKVQSRQIYGNSSSVRLLFTVHVPDSQLNYLAKLDLKLDLNEGSDCWNVLCKLIGRSRLQECSGSEIDLNILTGIDCELEIDHVCDQAEKYEFPLVVVKDIQLPGTMDLTGARKDKDSRNIKDK